MQSFVFYFNYVTAGNVGNCSAALRERDHWLNAFGFTDVPVAWIGLYYQYRVALSQAVDATEPIATLCAAGGGTLSQETDQAIYAALDAAQNQLYQVEQQAATMP
jgi:hypothetical protein